MNLRFDERELFVTILIIDLYVFAFRFLFILLGPSGRGPQYHEIGRSMATLMTDEVTGVFHGSSGVYLALNDGALCQCQSAGVFFVVLRINSQFSTS